MHLKRNKTFSGKVYLFIYLLFSQQVSSVNHKIQVLFIYFVKPWIYLLCRTKYKKRMLKSWVDIWQNAQSILYITCDKKQFQNYVLIVLCVCVCTFPNPGKYLKATFQTFQGCVKKHKIEVHVSYWCRLADSCSNTFDLFLLVSFITCCTFSHMNRVMMFSGCWTENL